VEFRLLGDIGAQVDGQVVDLGRRHERLLLGLLLLEPGRAVPIDRLADLLWDGAPPAGARAAIHTYVARLRSHLARRGPAIVTCGSGYRIDVDPDRVDYHRIRAAVLSDGAGDEPSVHAERLAAALTQLRDPLLGEVATGYLGDRISGEQRELLMVALERYADAELGLGRPDRVIAALAEVAVQMPVRESLVASLMTAYARGGRTGDALAAYRSARTTLVQELGVEPGVALQRLHREILRGAPDPADAPQVAAVPRQLPRVPGVFLGREDEQQRLIQALTSGSTRAAVAIAGVGGVGKTALAVAVAHAVAGTVPDGQLFVDLQGASPAPVTPAVVLARFLEDMGVPVASIPAALSERRRLFKRLAAARRMLIVLDNAASREQVAPLIPEAATCAVIVTSRRRLALDSSLDLDLGLLAPDAALRILAVFGDSDKIAADPGTATRIAELCGHLPLALRVVAAHIADRPQRRLPAVEHLLSDERRRLDTLRAGEHDVRASIALSYHALSAGEQRLLRGLGLLDVADFPAWLAAAVGGGSAVETEEILDRLVAARLLEAADGARFRFHDLIRLYARERAHEADSLADTAATFHRAYDAVLSLAQTSRDVMLGTPQTVPVAIEHPPAVPPSPPDRAALLACLDAESHNIVPLVAQALRRGEFRHAWQIPYLLYTYFDTGRRTHDALAAARVAVAAAEKAGDLTAQRIMHGHLAALARNASSGEEALRSLDQVLDLARRTGSRRAELYAHINLSSNYKDVGRLDEAAATNELAYKLLVDLDDDSVATGALLGNMANTFERLGDPDKAYSFAVRAREITLANGITRVAADAILLLAYLTAAWDPDAALRLADEAESVLHGVGAISNEIDVICMRAFVHARRGDITTAFDLLHRARELNRTAQQLRKEAYVYATFGLVFLMTDDEPSASRALDMAQVAQRLPKLNLTGLPLRRELFRLFDRADRPL